MKHGTLRPNKAVDHWQLLHESDWEDTDCKLLLHMDGADASTTFTDSATGKTVTPQATAQIDTDQWKFNGASGLFDGNSDYLVIADNDDWALGTSDFTIDMWVRFNSLASAPILFMQYQNGTNYQFFGLPSSSTIRYEVYDAGVNTIYIQGNYSFAVDTWYHIAMTRSGNDWNIYVDGTSVVNSTNASSVPNFTGQMNIGCYYTGTPSSYLNGWLDEFRWVKGSAKWTGSTFTVPTVSYLGRTTTYPITTDRNTVLMISGEGVDASTSIIDECGKTVTAVGTAQIDTAQYKFGQSSVLFDGNSDYLTIPNSSDWQFGSQEFTIDCWARFTSLPSSSYMTLCGKWVTVGGQRSWWCALQHDGSNYKIYFAESTDGLVGTVQSHQSDNLSISTGTWYHFAVVRDGDTLRFFLDGVAVGTSALGANRTFFISSANLWIGAINAGSYFLDGWMDDIRISKGIARWTSAFTPPLQTTALINGDTDDEYKIECMFRGAVAATTYRLFPNNDSTTSNYWWQELTGSGAVVSANRVNYGIWIGYTNAGNICQNESILYTKSGQIRTELNNTSRNITGTTVDYIYLFCHFWNQTTQHVAALQISSDKTDSMDCGTKLLIYRKTQ